MTKAKPTHEEIVAAHEALEKLCDRLPATRAAKESILRVLPPKPQPTMAEVEWDDEKHYLAEAKHPEYGKVIMLYHDGEYGGIQHFYKNGNPSGTIFSDPDDLTLTGKRYTLAEM